MRDGRFFFLPLAALRPGSRHSAPTSSTALRRLVLSWTSTSHNGAGDTCTSAVAQLGLPRTDHHSPLVPGCFCARSSASSDGVCAVRDVLRIRYLMASEDPAIWRFWRSTYRPQTASVCLKSDVVWPRRTKAASCSARARLEPARQTARGAFPCWSI
ncbi:hypothetical protein EXIGLDRAFT_420468 [Exidia glandulosa HHB12029]|uniref:Uncharacterized protein n=1 Tax=Exidia glandulosa HHB12029 TaxID=1314781 RepID=A0A166AZJ0_EXIGL|nr:hypothetical protein EXIGLDRAFT_420468 [Exidia glandulosa HHB12029]